MTFVTDWPNQSLTEGKAKGLVDDVDRMQGNGGTVGVDPCRLKTYLPDSRISTNLGHLIQLCCCVQTDVTVF